MMQATPVESPFNSAILGIGGPLLYLATFLKIQLELSWYSNIILLPCERGAWSKSCSDNLVRFPQGEVL